MSKISWIYFDKQMDTDDKKECGYVMHDFKQKFQIFLIRIV